MWAADYTAETDSPPSAVWQALESIHSPGMLGGVPRTVALDGPFQVGTTRTATDTGHHLRQSVITQMRPETVYAEQTEFGGLQLTFRYELTPTHTGGTTVRHTLEMTGPFVEHIGPKIGFQICSNFPTTLIHLLAHAKSSEF